MIRKCLRRLGILLIVFVLGGSFFPLDTAQAEAVVSAEAAIVIDAESGRVLFERNSEEQLRIASITKIMTAIVAIELGDLQEQVTTSKNAFGVEGSSIYLRLGEKLTLEDMLYGLMLRSGNDAAVAIAEHIGGSLEGFVLLMNQKAAELGMTESVFGNPHGLDHQEEHYSTAYDMAVLTAYAMQNEDFATIVGTKRATAPLEGEKWDRIWHNKNRLLSKYPYAEGVKTGYTKRANRTLVSSASKDGHRLIAVTLNGPDDWNDHIHMFEYGFNNFTKVTVTESGSDLRDERYQREDGTFQIMNNFYYPLLKDEHIEQKISLDDAFEQEELERIPTPAGYVHIHVEGQEVGRVAIQFIPEKKEKSSFWRLFHLVLARMLGGA